MNNFIHDELLPISRRAAFLCTVYLYCVMYRFKTSGETNYGRSVGIVFTYDSFKLIKQQTIREIGRSSRVVSARLE